MTQPYNPITDKPYLGGNIARLAHAECWAGFNQWLTKGLAVKKGEKGTQIITLITVTNKAGKTQQVPRTLTVFHAGQVEAAKPRTERTPSRTHADHTHAAQEADA